MKMMKQILVLLCLLVLAVPVYAMEAPTEATVPATPPPLVVGVRTLTAIPESWNPLEQRDADQNAILKLTAEPLYQVYNGAVLPAQAAEMPVDVTAELAGCYHIPANATRGYAFAITIRDGLCWDNGKELTISDWAYTVGKQLELGIFPLEIANYRAYLQGYTAPATEIISLMDAGFDSAMEAEAAGIQDFYLDSYFWGLDEGWFRITDRTRLFDEAIPSGCEEMYVTPAYLYREYLGETGTQTMFQSEFVGIPVQAGEKMTMEDVGVFVDGNRLVLVLQEQTTATHLALSLSELYPVPRGTDETRYGTAENYFGCGPYSVAAVENDEILLVPNPYWTGAPATYEQVSCRSGS